MTKLDMTKVRECFDTGSWTVKDIPAMQIAVYVMCGGGMIGRLAAEQPADFYIDDRVSKRPYPKKAIYQAVEILKQAAESFGLDSHAMPAFPRFHNMGVF